MVVYIQIFCRSVVVFVFIISFVSKVRHVATFQQTITNFALLPKHFSRLAALLFLLAEALVVATHSAGKKKSRVGVTREGIIFELFFTRLPQQGFTGSDVVELYLHCGALLYSIYSSATTSKANGVDS